MRRPRPLIAITMRVEPAIDKFYLARHYSEAVEAAGGLPVHLSLIPDREYVAGVIARMDGLLLPGSASDVDPAQYGRARDPKLGEVHSERDGTDLLAIEEAERARMPLLAICFGLQVWNVSRGGTLIQDIGSHVGNALRHEQGLPRNDHSHVVRVTENSLIWSLAGSAEAGVNSHHHQAIETVGGGLVPTAWAPDGIIEAVEDTTGLPFGLGVQWHPEASWEDDDLSKAIFREFVTKAALHAESRADVRGTETVRV